MKVELDTSELKRLKDAVQKRILKKALRAAAKITVQDVRNRVPQDTGTLKKAITSKVDAKKGGITVFSIVGPRSKYVRTVKNRLRRPGRYAHIVERRYHPLRLAWNAGKYRAIGKANDVIEAEITKELSK